MGAASRDRPEGEREREGRFCSCGGRLVPEYLQHKPAVIWSLQAWWAGNGAPGESMPSQARATLEFCKEAGITGSTWPICSEMDGGEASRALSFLYKRGPVMCEIQTVPSQLLFLPAFLSRLT